MGGERWIYAQKKEHKGRIPRSGRGTKTKEARKRKEKKEKTWKVRIGKEKDSRMRTRPSGKEGGDKINRG